MLGDEPHAPGQRVRPTPGHAGRDERVQRAPLGHAQAGHDRQRERREEPLRAADADAPGDGPAEAVLGVVRDAHAGLARLLAEGVGPSLTGGGTRGIRGVLAQLDVGQLADDEDLLAVDMDFGRPDEPALGEAAGEPALDLVGGGVAVHVVAPRIPMDDYLVTD